MFKYKILYAACLQEGIALGSDGPMSKSEHQIPLSALSDAQMSTVQNLSMKIITFHSKKIYFMQHLYFLERVNQFFFII